MLNFIGIIACLTMYNPENISISDVPYNYHSEFDINFNLPLLVGDNVNTYLSVHLHDGTINYNNTNSYDLFIYTTYGVDQSVQIDFYNGSNMYNVTFTQTEQVGSTLETSTYFNIDYFLECDSGGYVIFRLYNGDSYLTSSVKSTYSAPVPQGWFMDYVYDTPYEGIEVANTSTIDFSSSGPLKSSLIAQIGYNMAALSDNTGSYQIGYDEGLGDGYNDGFSDGYTDGYRTGDTDGYSRGFEDGYSADTTVVTIFSGILAVGMLPINFFLAIFNFEILGINLASFMTSIFTACVAIIVVKRAFAIKGD